jgi:hypothetical protein
MQRDKPGIYRVVLLLCPFLHVTACEHEFPGEDASVAMCGDGKVVPPETCDPVSACPTDCNDGDGCTVDTLVGSAENCDAMCTHAAVIQCQSADGCCPPGCSIGTDSDCPIACGDGVVSQGETCDPPSSCPLNCDDGDYCTEDVPAGLGTAETCNPTCGHIPAQCGLRDGCCYWGPRYCSPEMDPDCRNPD